MMPPNDPTHSASLAPELLHNAPLRLSLSEINALCFKAARGAGLHWGEAEEAGWAAAWLARAGFAGPSIMLAWLHDVATLDGPAPAPGRWAAQERALCPLRTGIALADFAGLPEGPGARALSIAMLAHPLVTLPFVARAAGRVDLQFRLGWTGVDLVLDEAGLAPGVVTPQGNHRAGVDLTITPFAGPAPAKTAGGSTTPVRAIALQDWQALDALALRVTVPPSAQSRAGAGAAGDDND